MGRQERVLAVAALTVEEGKLRLEKDEAGLGLGAGVRLLTPPFPHKVPASRIGCPLPVTRFLQNPCLEQQYLAKRVYGIRGWAPVLHLLEALLEPVFPPAQWGQHSI